MKTTKSLLASVACALPLLAVAQPSTAPSATDKAATPPAGMENKKSSATGQSTTYPTPDASAGAKKSGMPADNEKDKITKGGANTQTHPMAPLDPSTANKPAKPGSESGPAK